MYLRLDLGYFKQGDDLSYHLGKYANSILSLKDHAEQLRFAADHLDEIVSICEDFKENPKIDADGHSISLKVSDELGAKLLEEGLVEEYLYRN